MNESWVFESFEIDREWNSDQPISYKTDISQNKGFFNPCEVLLNKFHYLDKENESFQKYVKKEKRWTLLEIFKCKKEEQW